jgi:hypothetical protein
MRLRRCIRLLVPAGSAGRLILSDDSAAGFCYYKIAVFLQTYFFLTTWFCFVKPLFILVV